MKKLISHGLILYSTCALSCPDGARELKEISEEEKIQEYCMKDNKKVGPFLIYSIDGDIEVKGNFKENKLNGKYFEYHQEKIVKEGYYKDNLQENEWIRYWPNGNLRDRGHWKKNEPVGVWSFYDRSGKLIKTKNFDKKGLESISKNNLSLLGSYFYTDNYGNFSSAKLKYSYLAYDIYDLQLGVFAEGAYAKNDVDKSFFQHSYGFELNKKIFENTSVYLNIGSAYWESEDYLLTYSLGSRFKIDDVGWVIEYQVIQTEYNPINAISFGLNFDF
jgi:hypothetical protein